MQAKGSFTVKIVPLEPSPAEGIGRFSINKEIHGDLEATSQGEMFSGGDPQKGVAGYVAMEIVSGTLAGRRGSFALQHNATMGQADSKLDIIVVPGSGTGDLQGLSGIFKLRFQGSDHFYELEYNLPE